MKAIEAKKIADEFVDSRDNDIDFIMCNIYEMVKEYSEKGKYFCAFGILSHNDGKMITDGQIDNVLCHLEQNGYKREYLSTEKVIKISWQNETS